MKLDIAAGQRKEDGWTGIDIMPGSDIEADLFQFPWPIDDDSVDQVRCQHFVEHIPHYRPEWGSTDGWWMFWREVYRICKPGATIEIVHPYVKSDRSFWDPTHVRFIHEVTWYYLDATWRKAQGLDHYPAECDFEVVVIEGLGIAQDIATRNAEFQAFARDHYWNSIADLKITLKSRKPEAPEPVVAPKTRRRK